MVLESTMICIDNSEYMRNEDFSPSRLLAEQNAAHLLCHSKMRSNPENNIGLLNLANVEVLATLTSDIGKVISKLYNVQLNGDINLHTGIRIAQLALKHREGKNHKMRIVCFVGSPVTNEERELLELAKKLKKENVNVDIISFGEDVLNSDLLSSFINALNRNGGTSSHLLTVSSGSNLSDVLLSSPIIQGEDGTGGAGLTDSYFEFGFDVNEDPELALALRLSMAEERRRQENEARRVNKHETSEKYEVEDGAGGVSADFANMTDDEQLAFALKLSMQGAQESIRSSIIDESEMEEGESDVSDDASFLQFILESFPGIDPESEEVRETVRNLKNKKKTDKENKEENK